MQSEKYYRRITCELINNSGSELEVLRKIDLIRNALHTESEVFNQLSQLKPRLKRMLNKNQNGLMDYDSFDINMNKILNSANQILRIIELKDIAIDFEFDEKNELIYHVTDSQNQPIYRFIGNLKDYRPHGEGIAKYPNEDTFNGNFKKGNREGFGTLYNSDNTIIHEGNWSNNKFLDRTSIRFFPNIRVAADSIANPQSFQETNFEIIKIPQLRGENMIAFPVDGDSMEPNFIENDIIICKKMSHHREIKDGKIYIIYHEDTLVIKRVKKVTTENNESPKYSLISDNYINHPPYQITPNEGTKFHKLLMQLKSH